MTQLPHEFLTTPITHRTLHDRNDGRPENSVEGAQAAIAAGYGIEIDVQVSRDGDAMVFHDYDLARLTGAAGLVRDRKTADLRGISPTGGQAGIPTLATFLELVAGRVPLVIELKDQDGALGDAASPLEKSVCDAVRGYVGPVALMSFNPHMIARCAQMLPDVPRGLVTDPYRVDDWPDVPDARRAELAQIPDFDRVGASFISHKVADLSSPRVAELKAAGAGVLCWTVRSAKQEATAREVADNITFEGYLAAKQ